MYYKEFVLKGILCSPAAINLYIHTHTHEFFFFSILILIFFLPELDLFSHFCSIQ